MSRPAASASRPSCSCSAATALHAPHQSAHRSRLPVIRSKSPAVTPLVVNRGDQCEIAIATRSSIDCLPRPGLRLQTNAYSVPMGTVNIRATVNGTERVIQCEPDAPLLDVLRQDLGLAGPRFGCGVGVCGACFVLIGGRARSSCDFPA